MAPASLSLSLSSLPPELLCRVFQSAEDFSVISGRSGSNGTHLLPHLAREFDLAVAPRVFSNLADAQRSDRQAFGRFFHRCLDAGLYLAPSQFETGFISLAHTPADIDQTLRIIRDGLAS